MSEEHIRSESKENLCRSTPSTASLPSCLARGVGRYAQQDGPFLRRAMWAVVGIHDALVAGKTDEARAGAALGLAAWDQSAEDSGTWMMATTPSTAVVPEWMEGIILTRIGDPRWIEILMSRLRDQDQYAEAKQRLSAKRRNSGTGREDLLQAPTNPDGSPPKESGKTKGGRAQPQQRRVALPSEWSSFCTLAGRGQTACPQSSGSIGARHSTVRIPGAAAPSFSSSSL